MDKVFVETKRCYLLKRVGFFNVFISSSGYYVSRTRINYEIGFSEIGALSTIILSNFVVIISVMIWANEYY